MDRPGERTAMIHLTLLTRDGCRLCDEMKEVVGQVQRSHRLTLTEVDISTQPELERRWGTEIPVLLDGGRVIARHRISARRLVDAVSRATSPSR